MDEQQLHGIIHMTNKKISDKCFSAIYTIFSQYTFLIKHAQIYYLDHQLYFGYGGEIYQNYQDCDCSIRVIDCSIILATYLPTQSPITATGSSNDMKFLHYQSSIDCFKYSFFPSTIPEWNMQITSRCCEC